MARKEEAADLVVQGYPPSRISIRMGISYASVKQYLCTQVGEGCIFRYQILQAMDRAARDAVEFAIEQGGPFKSAHECAVAAKAVFNARGCSMQYEDLLTYIEFRHAVLADMYELIRKIELNLHQSVKKACTERFGVDAWWCEGIPENVRVECAANRERDPEPAKEAYCYTTLIQLKEIYDKKWAILASTLPDNIRADKPKFLVNIFRLNRIRNSVMHPVRGIVLCDDDFSFVQKFIEMLQVKI